VPANFGALTNQLCDSLQAHLVGFENLIVHNVFTKRFNLPLTAALFLLLDQGLIPNCIAWCHDIGWTSDHSRSALHGGYPWDLLRTQRDEVTYVVVSEQRQAALAGLFGCPLSDIRVIHNGVDPGVLLGLSEGGSSLIERLGLWGSDLILLMPVRVTQAKNIELALRVLAALKARNRRVRLVVTGPPDPHDEESVAYFDTLRVLRREMGVEDDASFVFEAGPEADSGFTIDMSVVADLYRASDVLFMPSHREGFGMPILEAGLVGIPVVCTEVPAAREIGGDDVTVISQDGDPDKIADVVLSLAEGAAVHRLRRRVRQGHTWQAIFRRHIEPLLQGGGGT
jgi:glycosyltransferase involved in cell wall biosynthesis